MHPGGPARTASEGRRRGLSVVDGLDLDRAQHARGGPLRGNATRGKQTIVPDLDEAVRQRVQQKAPREFIQFEFRCAFATGSETDGMLIDLEDATVRDRDPMGVTSEVRDDLLGAGHRTFGVDDPFLLIQPTEKSLQVVGGDADDFTAVVQFAQAVQILTSKQCTHDIDGKEVALSSLYPRRAIGRQTATGDQTVHVRMQTQVPRPCVQHHRNAKLRTEPRGVSAQFEQRLRCRFEEQPVELTLVAHRERAQGRRQCKDDVEVVGVEQPLESASDPLLLSAPLTSGAVPVATRVVRDLRRAAVQTHICMSAERGGSTTTNGMKHFRPRRRQLLRVEVTVVAGHSENVGDLMSRTHDRLTITRFTP